MTDVSNIPLENAYETNLSASISATDTTCTVDTAPQVSLPAGQTMDAVIDPENSSRERVIITDISGTTLTITRGQPDYYGDSGTAYPHGGGATLVITDSWSVFNDMATAINSKIDTADGQLAVYADAAARDAAIPSPSNGMQCYNTAEGCQQDYVAGAWVNRDTGTTFTNASETAAGKVEKATAAELAAGTGTGGTGAELFVGPDNSAVIDDSSGAADAGKWVKLDSGGRLKASMVHLDSESLEDDGSDNVQVKLDPDGGLSKSASGLATRTDDVYTTDYTYGESISSGDALYLKRSDNKLYKTTSSPDTWALFVGVADEDGSANDTGKRVKLRGLIEGASFSAIAPTFEYSGGSTAYNLGNNANTMGYAQRIDNTGGPEFLVNGNLSFRAKRVGTPAVDLTVMLVLGDSTGPYVSGREVDEDIDGMILTSTTVAVTDTTFDDYNASISNERIPANCYAWVVWFVADAVDAVNYYALEGAATGGTSATLIYDTTANWSTGGNYAFNYSLPVSSINPWDSRFAVRLYGDGNTGGVGIGDSSSASPWARVVGHVVSSTEWYLNPDTGHHYSGTFSTYQDHSNTAVTIAEESLGFRPSWIDINGVEVESGVATRTMLGCVNYHSHDSEDFTAQGIMMSDVDVGAGGAITPYTGRSLDAALNSNTPWVFYPLEDGFICGVKQRHGNGIVGHPDSNRTDQDIHYIASQK